MKLHQKPSEFYKDLQENIELLGLFVSSPTQAELLLSLINRTESELSQSKSEALINQGRSISAHIYNNFQDHILNTLQFHDLQVNGITNINTLSDLVENFQAVIKRSTSSPDRFFENFAKTSEELDKEYMIEKGGLKHHDLLGKDIIVKQYRKTYNDMYNLYHWDDNTQSINEIAYNDIPLEISHILPHASGEPLLIDSKRGLFQLQRDETLSSPYPRKYIGSENHELQYIVDKNSTYAIFKNQKNEYFIPTFTNTVNI